METPSPFSLKDKSILITGGSSGIGLGQCLRFLQEGAKVAIADNQTPPPAALDGGANYIKCDVTQREQVMDALQNAVQRIGVLDVIIHNAGKPGKGARLTESDEEILDGGVALK